MKGNISPASDHKQAQSALLVQLAQALLKAAGVPEPEVVPQLIPISQPEKLIEAGIGTPRTHKGWQYAYSQRAARGTAAGFVKSGHRVLVDVEKYKEALRAQHDQALRAQLGAVTQSGRR